MILGFDELVAAIERLFDFGCLFVGRLDQHTRSRALRLAGLAHLSSALHVNVGDVLVFAQDGQVAKHIDGGDVGSDDYEAVKYKSYSLELGHFYLSK